MVRSPVAWALVAGFLSGGCAPELPNLERISATIAGQGLKRAPASSGGARPLDAGLVATDAHPDSVLWLVLNPVPEPGLPFEPIAICGNR